MPPAADPGSSAGVTTPADPSSRLATDTGDLQEEIMSTVVTTTTTVNAGGQGLDFGQVFKHGWRLFAKDLGVLIIGTILVGALSVLTIGVLAGPLFGGLYGMLVGRVRDGKTPHVGDVFGQFDRFWSFFGAFWVLAILIGLASLTIVGGILLGAVWLYVFPVMVDRRMGFGDAMGESYRIVKGAFWEHVGLVIVFVVISSLANGLLTLLATPFLVALVVAGYYVAAGRGAEVERV